MKRILILLQRHALLLVICACCIFLALVALLGIPYFSPDASDAYVLPTPTQVQVKETQYTQEVERQENRIHAADLQITNPFTPGS